MKVRFSAKSGRNYRQAEVAHGKEVRKFILSCVFGFLDERIAINNGRSKGAPS